MFINNQTQKTEPEKWNLHLQNLSSEMLKDFFDETPEFTFSYVEPDEIRKLNKEFRSVDNVTDVLSFPSGDEVDPETGLLYLGDIAVCLDRAQEQADQSGHPLENEVTLLMIHGILHLMGYDHSTSEEKQEMWKLQNEYLDKFGCHINRKPGEDFDF